MSTTESKNRLDGFILLVKLHPRENEKIFHYISKNENINIKLIKHIDPLLINYFSDIVI